MYVSCGGTRWYGRIGELTGGREGGRDVSEKSLKQLLHRDPVT